MQLKKKFKDLLKDENLIAEMRRIYQKGSISADMLLNLLNTNKITLSEYIYIIK